MKERTTDRFSTALDIEYGDRGPVPTAEQRRELAAAPEALAMRAMLKISARRRLSRAAAELIETRSLGPSALARETAPAAHADSASDVAQDIVGSGYRDDDRPKLTDEEVVRAQPLRTHQKGPADAGFGVAKLVVTVFDGVLTGTTAQHGAVRSEEAVGFGDDLTIVVVASQVTGAGTTLTLQVEHSGDRIHWIAKNSLAELNAVPLAAGSTTTLLASEARRNASLGFVRLRMQLASTSGVPSAHLTVSVCTAWRHPDASSLPGAR